MNSREIRRGKGIQWVMETHVSFSEGYTVENLDTKSIGEARDDFERLFVTIRKVLEDTESYCLDNEEERLQLCQKLTEKIDKGQREIFERTGY